MGRIALAATAMTDDADFSETQIALARFYAEHQLPLVNAGQNLVTEGGESTVAVPVEML